MTRDREVQSTGAYYNVGLDRRGRFLEPLTNRIDTFTCSLNDADAFTAVFEPRTLPVGVRLKKEAMKECRTRSVCRGGPWCGPPGHMVYPQHLDAGRKYLRSAGPDQQESKAWPQPPITALPARGTFLA